MAGNLPRKSEPIAFNGRQPMSELDDLVSALRPVKFALESLEIAYFIGGSVASSWHGATRSTMDVDLVAQLSQKHIDPFLAKLSYEFYASKPAMVDAVERKSCFNLIHLATSFKVDIFVSQDRPFDVDSMARAQAGEIGLESKLLVPFASPEDIIVSKLEWYRLGNEASQRQWDDVTRVLQLLGDQVDSDYLNRAAESLQVEDLWNRLRREVFDQ